MRRSELAKKIGLEYKVVRKIIEETFPGEDWSSASKNVEPNLLSLYERTIREKGADLIEAAKKKEEAKLLAKKKKSTVKKKTTKTKKETKPVSSTKKKTSAEKSAKKTEKTSESKVKKTTTKKKAAEKKPASKKKVVKKAKTVKTAEKKTATKKKAASKSKSTPKETTSKKEEKITIAKKKTTAKKKPKVDEKEETHAKLKEKILKKKKEQAKIDEKKKAKKKPVKKKELSAKAKAKKEEADLKKKKAAEEKRILEEQKAKREEEEKLRKQAERKKLAEQKKQEDRKQKIIKRKQEEVERKKKREIENKERKKREEERKKQYAEKKKNFKSGDRKYGSKPPYKGKVQGAKKYDNKNRKPAPKKSTSAPDEEMKAKRKFNQKKKAFKAPIKKESKEAIKRRTKQKESFSRDYDINIAQELYELEHKGNKTVDAKDTVVIPKKTTPVVRRKGKKKKGKEPTIDYIYISEKSTAENLANYLNKETNEIIEAAKELDLWISPTQKLTTSEIELLCEVFEIKDYKVVPIQDNVLKEKTETKYRRAPIITVMGHIDHGKTTLLDALRNTNIVKSESGGITQHIGASFLETEHGDLCLIDTPGHSAFTAMRARGAQVCDIVILVVAADDGIQPQTVEAINHARAAKLPIIVAINKIDKNNARPQVVKSGLAQYNLMEMGMGGDNMFVEISALKKTGISDLLDAIHLQASELQLNADPNKKATGFVLEANIEKGKGVTASVVVTNGTLKLRDNLVCGLTLGKVRIMTDQNKKPAKEVLPSHPALLSSFDALPEPGDIFQVVESEKEAKEIINEKKRTWEQNKLKSNKVVDLETLFAKAQGEIKTIKIILKTDVVGTRGALQDIFSNFSYKNVSLDIIHAGLGDISDNDIFLASSSNALVIGFKVKIPKALIKAIDKEGIKVHIFNTIFEIDDYLKELIESGEEKVQEEKVIGTAEIRAIFNAGKSKIAGCYMREGEARRNAFVRIYRKKVLIHEGKIDSLKRGKDDAKKVKQGLEFGVKITGFNDLLEDDTIEFYIYE